MLFFDWRELVVVVGIFCFPIQNMGHRFSHYFFYLNRKKIQINSCSTMRWIFINVRRLDINMTEKKHKMYSKIAYVTRPHIYNVYFHHCVASRESVTVAELGKIESSFCDILFFCYTDISQSTIWNVEYIFWQVKRNDRISS